MKNRNQTIILLATVISAVLFIFFSYKAYNSYKAYKISQNADKYIAFLYRGDSLLQKLEDERLVSSYYIGSNGNVSFNKVEKARHKTDESIRNSKELMKIYPDFMKNLQYVRSRVDIISDEHQDILFKYYQDELTKPILNQMIKHTQELSLGAREIVDELLLYSELLKYKNKINSKNSFITYILANSKKLDKNDLLTLDNMLKDIKAPMKMENNTPLKLKLAIVQGINTGEFDISAKAWLDKCLVSMDNIIKAKKETFYKIQSKLKKMVASPQYLINNIAIALFFLISLLFSMKKLSQKHENTIVIQKDRRRSDKNSKNDDDKYIVLKYDKDNKGQSIVESEEIEFSKTAIRSFNPMQKFTNIVKILEDEFDKKDIGFKHKIDPDIPTSSIGNVSKIDEIFNILINYILISSSSDNFITFQAENIAQTKVENAVKSVFTKSNSNLNDISEEDDLTLLKIKKLASLTGGTFKVEDSENETRFIVTLNLKKGS